MRQAGSVHLSRRYEDVAFALAERDVTGVEVAVHLHDHRRAERLDDEEVGELHIEAEHSRGEIRTAIHDARRP